MATVRKKLNDTVASRNDDTARGYATSGYNTLLHRNDETIRGNATSVYALFKTNIN
ncbi:hypothetical protein E2C01_041649 [Portunus trituberculatus]|uniref:Uncharacterized protein n=1 Tax=Portunus trituberculatus TaxID=210409 RepID=A0A5B7FSF4_PORTR|nr:hypothetical protein [Portunus trituberculatus]